VIAGRHGDDAALAFVRRELQQRVERATLLERGGVLQVLELDPDVRQSCAGEPTPGVVTRTPGVDLRFSGAFD